MAARWSCSEAMMMTFDARRSYHRITRAIARSCSPILRDVSGPGSCH